RLGRVEVGPAVMSLLALAHGEVVGGPEADLVLAAVQQDLSQPLLGQPLLPELDVDHREVGLGFVLHALVPDLPGDLQGHREILEGALELSGADLGHPGPVEPLILLPGRSLRRRHYSPGACWTLNRR